jgi:hypothetical protein
MPEQLDAGDDTILAKGEATDAVVTSGTQAPPTLVTLDNARVLWMISAIQHFYSRPTTRLRLVLSVLVWNTILFGRLFWLITILVLFRSWGRALLLAAD